MGQRERPNNQEQMSKVLNGYVAGFGEDVGIYIGRGGKGKKGSPLANPYHIGRDGSRSEVIALYRVWLWDRIQNRDPKVLAELRRIYETESDVICFCAPHPCHGDVVILAAAWLSEEIPL